MIVLDTLNTEEQNRKQGAPRGQKRPFRPREMGHSSSARNARRNP